MSSLYKVTLMRYLVVNNLTFSVSNSISIFYFKINLKLLKSNDWYTFISNISKMSKMQILLWIYSFNKLLFATNTICLYLKCHNFTSIRQTVLFIFSIILIINYHNQISNIASIVSSKKSIYIISVFFF